MKGLFLLPYALDTAPGQRYRVEQWAPFLSAAGIKCDLRPVVTLREQHVISSATSLARKTIAFAGSARRAWTLLPNQGQYDFVWLYRSVLPAGPPLLERRLAALGTPIIYEFDDAIWLPKTMPANRRLQFLKWSHKTAEICELAAAVVVGNEFLADYASRYNPNVHIIPSTVDIERY